MLTGRCTEPLFPDVTDLPPPYYRPEDKKGVSYNWYLGHSTYTPQNYKAIRSNCETNTVPTQLQVSL